MINPSTVIQRSGVTDPTTLLEENYQERMHYSLRSHPIRFRRDEQAWWFSSGIDLPIQFFNSLYHYHFATRDLYREIAAVLSQVQVAPAPLYWLLNAAQQTAGLGAYLQEQGAQALGTVWGMSATLDLQLLRAGVAPDLTFQRVSTSAQVATFVDTILAAEEVSPLARQQWIDWEMALGLAEEMPWQRYLAYRHGAVVATAALFYGAQTVGLYHVATRLQVRGQGIGAAMTRFALQQAHRQNYRQSVLIATPPAVNIYRQLGFRVCKSIYAYLFT